MRPTNAYDLCVVISSIIKFPFNKKIYKEVNFLVVVDVIKLFSNNLFSKHMPVACASPLVI